MIRYIFIRAIKEEIDVKCRRKELIKIISHNCNKNGMQKVQKYPNGQEKKFLPFYCFLLYFLKKALIYSMHLQSIICLNACS